MRIQSAQEARDFQQDMNFHRRKEVKEVIAGFVAATVEYSEKKDATEINVWVRGEPYGLKGDYRMDFEASRESLDDMEPEDVWELISSQFEDDAADHRERFKNGRYTGDADNFEFLEDK
jgi:hypothetical protein